MRRSSFIEGTFIATIAIIIVKIMGMLYVIPFYAVIGIEGSALYAYAYNIYNMSSCYNLSVKTNHKDRQTTKNHIFLAELC